jgi:probable rRNA maturation factor
VPAAGSLRNFSQSSVSEVSVHGRRLPLSPTLVRRVVEGVLREERRDAIISVTFLGRDTMRRMNAEHKSHDHPTDVLTFTLKGPRGQIVGDVYICPWVAQREARERGIPLRQELIRLVVHGTLHALGRDHPEGPRRTRSAMWRRQERYVETLA